MLAKKSMWSRASRKGFSWCVISWDKVEVSERVFLQITSQRYFNMQWHPPPNHVSWLKGQLYRFQKLCYIIYLTAKQRFSNWGKHYLFIFLIFYIIYCSHFSLGLKEDNIVSADTNNRMGTLSKPCKYNRIRLVDPTWEGERELKPTITWHIKQCKIT